MPAIADVFMRMRVDSNQVKRDAESGLDRVDTRKSGIRAGNDYGDGLNKGIVRGIDRAAKGSDTRFAAAGRSSGSVFGDTFSRNFSSKLTASSGALTKLGDGKASGTGFGDTFTRGFLAKLGPLRAQIDKDLGSKDLRVRVDAAKAQADLAKLAASVAKATGNKQIKIDADTLGGVVKARKAGAEFDRIARFRTTGFNVDTGAATAKAGRFNALLNRIARRRTANIDVDVDRSSLSRATGLFGGAGGNAGRVFNKGLKDGGGGGGGFGGGGFMSPAVILPLVALGLAALPGAFAAVGALGGVALGAAFAIRGSQALQNQGKSLLHALDKTMVDAAKVLIKPISQAMNVLKGQLPVIGRLFSQTFAAVAPLVTPIVRMLTGLVTNILPGFNALMRASAGPLAAFFVAVGKIVGSGFGDFFKALIPAVKPSLDVIIQLLKLFVAFLPLIATLSNAFAQVFSPVLRALVGVVNALVPPLQLFINGLLKALLPLMPPITQAIVQLAGLLGGAFSQAVATIIPVLSKMINELLKALVPLLPVLVKFIGQLASAFSTVFTAAIVAILPSLTQLAIVVFGALARILPAILPLITQFVALFTAQFVGLIVAVLPPLVQLAGKVFGAMAQLLPVILPPLISFAGVFTQALVDILAKLLPPLVQLAGRVMDSLAALLPIVVPLIVDFFKKFTPEIADIVERLIPPLAKLANAVMDALAAALPVIVPLLGAMLGLFTQALVGVVSSIVDALGKIVGALPPGVLTDIALAVGALVLAWKAYKTAVDLAKLATLLFEASNPIGWIALIGAAIVTVAVLIITHWGAVTRAFGSLFNWVKAHWPLLAAIITGGLSEAIRQIVLHWSGIVGFFKGIWHGIHDNFVAPLTNFFTQTIPHAWGVVWTTAKTIFGNLGRFFTGVWNGIQHVASTVWNFIKGVVLGVWNALKAAAGVVWRAIRSAIETVWNVLRRTASVVWNGIKGVVLGVWNALKAAASVVWRGVRAAVEAVWNALKRTASIVWNGIKGIVLGVWNALKAAAGVVWRGIRGAIETVWNVLKRTASVVWNAIRGAIETVWNTLKRTATAIWNGIRGAIETVWNVLRRTASTIWNGIRAAIELVWNTLKRTASTIWNAIKGFFGRLWTDISNGVKSAWNAIKKFFIDVWHGIQKIASTVWNAIKGFLGRLWTDISNGIKSAWNAIRKFFTDTWNNIWNLTKSIVSTISRWLGSAWTTIKKIATTTWNAIKKFFTDTWNSIWNTTKSIVSTVSRWLGSAWSTIKTIASGAWNVIKGVILGVWNGISNGIMTVVKTLKGWLSAAWSGIKTAAVTAWNTIWNGIKDISTRAVNFIISVIDMLIGAMDAILSFVGQKHKGGGDARLFPHAGPISVIQPLGSTKKNPLSGPGFMKWFASGGVVHQGTTETADDVVVRVSKNETIVSAAHSRLLAPAFSAVGVPGYKQSARGPGRTYAQGGVPIPGFATGGTPSISMYRNPVGHVSGLIPMRIDQGVDYGASRTSPLVALGAGTMGGNTNPGWPGGQFWPERLSDGPLAGINVFYAEHIRPLVHSGQKVKAGQHIFDLIPGSPNLEIGFALPDGSNALAKLPAAGGYREGQKTAVGELFNQLLVKLGAPSGTTYGRKTTGKIPGGVLTGKRGGKFGVSGGGGGFLDQLLGLAKFLPGVGPLAGAAQFALSNIGDVLSHVPGPIGSAIKVLTGKEKDAPAGVKGFLGGNFMADAIHKVWGAAADWVKTIALDLFRGFLGADSGGGAVGKFDAGTGNEKSVVDALLQALNAPVSPANEKSMFSWIAHEFPWPPHAKFNPMATTLKMPGSTNFNSVGPVQNYTSWQQGIEANAKTILHSGYPTIVADLRRGNGITAAAAHDLLRWSGGGYSSVAHGGTLTQKVYGLGADGHRYTFAEQGPERIVPSGSDPMLDELRRLNRNIESIPGRTAAGVAKAIKGPAGQEATMARLGARG